MKKLLAYLRYRWLLAQWRRRSRNKRRANVRVGNPDAFFHALDQRRIAYVVLRGFSEVPKTSATEKSFRGDLDLLVESSQLEEFCRTVAEFPGKVKIDLYSTGIRLGTDCKRIAYLPPVLGSELLADRCRHEDRFFRPSPRLYLYSLLYHCVYQKGLLCGLPTGTDLPNHETCDHDVRQEIAHAAAAAGETLPSPLTLLAIHQWLQRKDWSMPFDLLGRWPSRNAWHDALLHRESASLTRDLGNLADLFVFLIREDAVRTTADQAIIQCLRRTFTILDTVQLDPRQRQRVMRDTRGGDWTERKGSVIVPPAIAVVCHDPNPQTVEADSVLARLHHQVRNRNAFCKHRVREEMEQRFPGAVNFLHGSDNDPESMAYIKAIYGELWPRKIADWECVLMPTGRRRETR